VANSGENHKQYQRKKADNTAKDLSQRTHKVITLKNCMQYI